MEKSFCNLKMKWNGLNIAGDPGADHGDGQTPEAGGALKAPAGNTLSPETETGDLQADPGGLTVTVLDLKPALC